MSEKLLRLFFFVVLVNLVTCHVIHKRSAEEEEDDDKESFGFGDISLGSQQEAQSSQENVHSAKEGAGGIQQHHQAQQQLAAKIGQKHYVLQQQTSLGQQLARLGKKTAIQQLVDSQKQAIANGKVKKEQKVKNNEEVREDE